MLYIKEKGMMALILALAIIEAVAAGTVPMTALAILVIGLAYGFMNPIECIKERTAWLIVAALAGGVADSMNAIPTAGMYINHIVDSVAVAAGGVWIANFATSMYNRVKP